MKPYSSSSESLLKRPSVGSEKLESVVSAVFADVELSGDEAVKRYTYRFDQVTLDELAIDLSEVRTLADKTPKKLRLALDRAYDNIRKFHKTQVLQVTGKMESSAGVYCWSEARPIDKVGLYIPGGSAPLVSTVLMLGVPAQIAGCREIVMCTPPGKDGRIRPEICYAALKVGVTTLVSAGGAQAIAAMTFGTQSVPSVDKLFGPGNQYVTAAKQYAQKYGVAIDLPAGPSEVMVIADETAVPAYVAADLLSQAEHGPDSQVVLVTTDKTLYSGVESCLEEQLADLPRRGIAAKALENSYCLLVDTRQEAAKFANEYAPEHLILSVETPSEMAKMIVNAGSVFLGNYSPESAGDYATGTNHTLPTSGWARSIGGVGVGSFQKMVSFQRLTREGLKDLADTIVELAQAEGLEAHKRAVTIRLGQLDRKRR